MFMQLYRDDFRRRIPSSDCGCLSSRSSTAVEYSRARSHQRSHELRSLILNKDTALLKFTGPSHVAVRDNPSAGNQGSRREADAFGLQLRLNIGLVYANGGAGNLLILAADTLRPLDPETPQPSARRATADERSHELVKLRCCPTCSSTVTGSEPSAAILRRTALTNGAADRFWARFTNSTLSLMAACAGMRSRYRS